MRAIPGRSVSDARGIHVAAVASFTRRRGHRVQEDAFDARADGLVAVIAGSTSRLLELGEVLHDQRRVFPQDHPRRVRDAALDVPLPKQNVPV